MVSITRIMFVVNGNLRYILECRRHRTQYTIKKGFVRAIISTNYQNVDYDLIAQPKILLVPSDGLDRTSEALQPQPVRVQGAKVAKVRLNHA